LCRYASLLVPLVQEAVQVCLRAYADDPFNDNWTFGTHLWKNTWNRIKATAEIENNPVKTPAKGNEFCFSVGNATIHHHRVGGDSLLPRSAKKIKALVDDAQLPLFPQKKRIAFDNVILGISADLSKGLSEVFIGKLEKDASTDQYFWSEKVSLFKGHTTELGTPEYIFFEEEAEAVPVLTLGPQLTEHALPDTKSN
jgi:hypothetical protein